MNRAGSQSILRQLGMVAGGLTLATLMGYGFGKLHSGSGLETVRTTDRIHSRERSASDPETVDDWSSLATPHGARHFLNSLHSEAKQSPSPFEDWELWARLRKIFASLPAERFKVLASALLEMNAADEELESSDAFNLICQSMLAEWAAKDGPSAMAALKAGLPGEFYSVFRAWAAVDLDAAIAWVKEHRKVSGSSGLYWASSLGLPIDVLDDVAEKDTSHFERVIAGMTEGEAVSVIRYFGSKWCLDPERRAYVLDLAGRHDAVTETRQSIVGYWAPKEPQAALDFIDALGAPVAEKAELDALALSRRMAKEPASAMEVWLDRNGTQAPLPQGLVSDVATWVWRDQGPAVAWLQAYPEGSQCDQLCSEAIGTLIQYDAERPTVTAIACKIQDDTTRRKALRRIFKDCRREGSGTVAKWLRQIPEADRAALTVNPE